jgi:hypothetical protein
MKKAFVLGLTALSFVFMTGTARAEFDSGSSTAGVDTFDTVSDTTTSFQQASVSTAANTDTAPTQDQE